MTGRLAHKAHVGAAIAMTLSALALAPRAATAGAAPALVPTAALGRVLAVSVTEGLPPVYVATTRASSAPPRRP
jgi:hypothetical protein